MYTLNWWKWIRVYASRKRGRIYRKRFKTLEKSNRESRASLMNYSSRWGGGGIVRFEDKSQGEAQDNPPPNYLYYSLVRVSTRAWLASFFSMVRFRCLETVGFSAWILHSDQSRFDVASKSKGFHRSLESLACASFVDRGFSSVLYVS